MTSLKAQGRWRDNDDFERDLLSISDFADESPVPKPSIHARKARSKPTLSDDFHEEEQSKLSQGGRGRSILWQNGVPGGTPTFLQRQKETYNEIRETRNGYGYCNDQIEDMLKDKTDIEVKPMEHVKLNSSPIPLGSASSKFNRSPIPVTSASSKLNSSQIPLSSDSSRSSTPSQPSFSMSENCNIKKEEVPPLALSEILRNRNVKKVGIAHK